MNAAELMTKAERVLTSAKLLLASGDVDGARNRACSAMFDAERAALLGCMSTDAAETIRSHNGMIAAFGRHLVKTGKVSIERLFRRICG